MALYSVGRRRVMIALLLSSILAITLDLRGLAIFDAARTGFGYVLRPFEVAADVATRPISTAWRGITNYDNVVEENQRLRDENDRQRSDQISARNAIIENQRLLSLAGLESVANLPSVTATVVGPSPSNFDQQIEIDRGSLDQIEVGMAVVNEAGLVGHITKVSPDSSVVLLATDSSYAVAIKVISEEPAPVPTTTVPDSVPSGLDVGDVTTTTSTTTSTTTTTVPIEGAATDVSTSSTTTTIDPAAEDVSTTDPETGEIVIGGTTTTSTTLPPISVERETGVLRGRGGESLPLASLIADSPSFGLTQVGDTVFTAGGSTSLAPPNIPVGTVANVINRGGSQGTELEIELSADVDRLQFVRVIIWKPLSESGG